MNNKKLVNICFQGRRPRNKSFIHKLYIGSELIFWCNSRKFFIWLIYFYTILSLLNLIWFLYISKTKERPTGFWIQAKVSSGWHVKHDMLCKRNVSGCKSHMVHQRKTSKHSPESCKCSYKYFIALILYKRTYPDFGIFIYTCLHSFRLINIQSLNIKWLLHQKRDYKPQSRR